MSDDYQENRRRFLSDFSDDYGEGPYSEYDPSSLNFDLIKFPGLGGLDYAGSDFGYQDLDFAGNIFTNPELFAAFAEANPEDAEILRTAFLGNQARDIDDASISEDVIYTGDPDNSYKTAEENKFNRQTTGVPVGDPDDPDGTKKLAAISGDKTSITDKLKKEIARLTGLDENTVGELGKYGLLAGIAKMAYDDAQRAREEARGASGKAGTAVRAVRTPSGSTRYIKAASGGIMTLAGGGSVQPMYLGGVTDGMADEVPAHIDNKRPAALSDGEFVIPADVVSHLGNGNSNAGAKRLYEMMDSIREARTGNSKQGVQINPNKFLPG